MADVHSKKTRSYNMSQIKASNTKPEMVVRKFLHSNTYRYRIHSKRIFGRPDLFLKKYNTVIFIHGCFWHGHKNCRYAAVPKTNIRFWKNKIEGNIKRDKLVTRQLRKEGYNVIELWECQLKPNKRIKTFEKLIDKIHFDMI
jgi:DNA mismatch endonuclease, patch repair protein